jgi:hypothetical protein
MQAMRSLLFPFVVVAAVLAAAPSLAGDVRPIFRVDDAKATIVNRRLVISASGAVRSGGWDRPRLWVRQPAVPEASTLEVEFVARPPGQRAAVVQALLPVAALKRARLPNYGTIRVKIIAETNSLIVPISR